MVPVTEPVQTLTVETEGCRNPPTSETTRVLCSTKLGTAKDVQPPAPRAHRSPTQVPRSELERNRSQAWWASPALGGVALYIASIHLFLYPSVCLFIYPSIHCRRCPRG